MPFGQFARDLINSGTIQWKPIGGADLVRNDTLADALASQGVQVLTGSPPTANAPTEGLPADARAGQQFQFQSAPDRIYILGSDNVWRAIILVRVG